MTRPNLDAAHTAVRSCNKRRHDARRLAGVCINNVSHGPAFKGGRCETCWTAKQAAEKLARKAAREAPP